MALGAQGFPVAKIHALCTDEDVIGSWFHVMDMVEGRVFWDNRFPDVDRQDRPAYFDAMNAVIANHSSVCQARRAAFVTFARLAIEATTAKKISGMTAALSRLT